jgi:hypothetical protein
MTLSRLSCASLVLALALAVGPAAAQSTLFDIELGYQSVDVSGNQDMFRTQVDQDDGFVLRSLSVHLVQPPDSEALVERLRIDAAGFGGNPDGSFRLEASRARSYSLQLTYREMNAFSALPGFANPFLDAGIIPGQHTSDRQRDLFDFELEILPGHAITPIIGYQRSNYDGPGTTTYHVGLDEFLLLRDLDQTEQEFQLGFAFRAGQFKGSLIQGWRDFEGDQSLSLAPGAGAGNNPGEVIGQEISLDDYSRREETKTDGSVTRAYVTGRLGDRVRVEGEYVRSDYDSETIDQEAGSGNLISIEVRRIFSEFAETVDATTDNPAWRGEARVEAGLSDKLWLEAGYATSHREVDGWALISTLFLDTQNFAGADEEDIQRILEVHNALERDQDRFDITLTGRELGSFRAWLGYSLIDQDVTLEPDVAQIVVPGGQGGEFNRSIDAISAGVGYAAGSFSFSLDWQTEDADDAVVRTDFLERDRFRGRIVWDHREQVRITGTVEDIQAENPTPGIDYRGETLHWALDFDLTPTDGLTLRLAYDSYDADSELTFLRPETLRPAPSVYTEDGEVLDFGLLWRKGRFDVDARYSQLDNTGDRPLELDNAFLRFGVDLSDSFGIALELENWEYVEENFSLADYDADRYGLFLRWHN